jgi:hypothetical protein
MKLKIEFKETVIDLKNVKYVTYNEHFLCIEYYDGNISNFPIRDIRAYHAIKNKQRKKSKKKNPLTKELSE